MMKTEKQGPVGSGIKIDKMKKLAVMEMFKKNDKNIIKTSKDSGVNRQTLVKWINEETIIRKEITNAAKKLVTEVVTDTHKSISDIAVITNEQITQGMENVSDHITTSIYLRDLTLKRMIALTDKETDIDKLNKQLTAITKYIESAKVIKKSNDIPGVQTVNNNIQANFQCNEEVLILLAEKYNEINKDN